MLGRWFGWLVVCFIGGFGWLFVVMSIDWLVGAFVSWLVVWLIGRWVGLLVG